MGGTDPAGSSSSSATPIARWKWGVVWLMFLATMINYMDRQTMGATAAHIKRDFTLTNYGYGSIEAAFMYSFAVSQLLAGFLADRLNLRWLYAAALLVWSAAGFLTGMAEMLVLLMVCRIVLGFGEAFNWPCAVTIVGRILPREARSLANGIFHSGASIGAAITPLLVLCLLRPFDERDQGLVEYIRSLAPPALQFCIGGFDWRFIFQLVGGIGLLWAVLWFWVVRGQRAAEVNRLPVSAANPRAGSSFTSFWSVFTLRKFWIALTVSTTVNLSWHFYRVWLPLILQEDLHYSPHEMLFVFAAFFVAADLGSMAAGYVTRRIANAGVAVERARQIVMFGVSALCLLAIPVALLPAQLTLAESTVISASWIKVPLILILAAGAMGGFANMFALGQDVYPEHTGKVVGIMGSFPWFLLAALSPIVGAISDWLGTFAPMLVVVGFVPLIGAFAGLLWPMAGSIKQAAGSR
jgi:ACS family hexuronate transporter-like MFS transporter